MPFETRNYPQVVVFKEKVHIGGAAASSDREKQTVIVYDPQQDSYDTLSPYSYQWFSMAVVNNKLVLIGGWDAQTLRVTNQLGVWNEQSKRWTCPLPSMTTACSSPSVATHNNGWLVVIGGFDGKNHLSRVEIMDTTKPEQWYRASSLPQPCARAFPATIGNICYFLGGYTMGDAYKKVFSVCLDDLISQAVFKLACASAPPTPSPWQSLPDTPLTGSTALAFNGALLAFGGGLGSTAIYHYQPSSKSWIKAGELPIERSECTCAVLPSGDLYVAGGYGVKQVDIASVQ